MMLGLLLSLTFLGCSGEYRLVWELAPSLPACDQLDRCQFRVVRDRTDPVIFAAEIEEFKINGTVTSSAARHDAPTAADAEVFPILLCDSYIGLGYEVVPTGQADCTTPDPDFFMAPTAVEGGWFCINPSASQLQITDFFVLQVAAERDSSVGINLRIYPNQTRDGLVLTAICTPNRFNPPFTMSPIPTTAPTLSTAAPAITTAITTTATPQTTAAAAHATTTATAAGSDNTATIVVVVLILILLLGVAGFAFYRFRKGRSTSQDSTTPVQMDADYGDDFAGTAEDFL